MPVAESLIPLAEDADPPPHTHIHRFTKDGVLETTARGEEAFATLDAWALEARLYHFVRKPRTFGQRVPAQGFLGGRRGRSIQFLDTKTLKGTASGALSWAGAA